MRTLILDTIIKLIIPLFLLISIYMFFRGHDQPGGGFIGGLIASIPFMVHSIAFGSGATIKKYHIKPLFLAAAGLLLALISGIFSMILALPMMTGLWMMSVPLIGKIGTPTIFDTGVFLVVFGVVMQVTFLFSEE